MNPGKINWPQIKRTLQSTEHKPLRKAEFLLNTFQQTDIKSCVVAPPTVGDELTLILLLLKIFDI
jgi:hypothetical protein